MKSARERARDAFGIFHSTGWTRQRMEEEIEQMFAEHAQDQRRACATKVNALEPRVTGAAMRSAAFDAVLNAPAPGEDR